MRKIWDIHGGVHPPENKHQSNQTPIAQIPLAKELVLPLNQHIGSPATPVVQVGDTVLKGQLIADAQGVFSAAVHASTSGTVTAIEDRPIAHPSGMQGPCIVLQPDGEDRWANLSPCENHQDLSHSELIEKIRQAGLAGMGGAGFPTSVKINPRVDHPIKTLILNGTECEPYITADDRLMREYAEEILLGAHLLGKIVGHPSSILVGIEDNKPEAIKAMQSAAKKLQNSDDVAKDTQASVEIVVFPTKYPSGGEKQLIQILTGKEVPSGKIPAELGIVVQNVGTARAAWRAVRYGEPLIERVTTVVGKSLAKEQNIVAPIGTPIEHILEHHGFAAETCPRLVIGGPMMGFSVDNPNVPVVKTTNCILVPSHQEMPEAPPSQACIRCGLCAEACPASLLPQQLYWHAQAEDYDKLQSHNIMDCIECGACSFVCPSAIPLVQYYRSAKAELRQQQAERIKSEKARERFENRQQRIAQQEAAKEAKRQARKQAAEEAKKQLQAKTAADGPTATPTEKPSEKKAVDPEIQRKKLARALSSAESRVERVKKQQAECEDDARKDTLAAQLKQAQLKVEDAQAKLDAFDKGADQDLSDRVSKVEQKLKASPLESQIKAVETLTKRLKVAQEKAAEAEREGKPTVDALKQGVSKLQDKLSEAQQTLNELQQQPSTTDSPAPETAEPDAASDAIERAKAKAAALANMSDDEKRNNQITSLTARVEKAKAKLEKAEADNSEHVDVLRTALEKLEKKLTELKAT